MDKDKTLPPEDSSEEDAEESFADLFESYSEGMNDNLQVGDKIKGKIISITNSAVFVDTGTKADGIVEIEELKDEEGELPYRLGDELELFVVASGESEIRLSKAIAGIGGLNMLKDAFRNAIPVEGKVVQAIKGGFQVEILKRRAFCPISQIDTQYVENNQDYVGQTLEFQITKFEEGGRNIVLSRRKLLEAEMQESRKAFMQELAVDQIHTGRITRIMPYGVFVELATGVEGMVHISELSWSRVEKPDDVVSPGDQIDVKVLRIEPGEKQEKIALSAKHVTGDPWERVGNDFAVGQRVTGKVTRCAPFGAFVEIMPGVDGLVHISEMSYTKRVLNPEEIVQSGQSVSVVIKELDPYKRRIGLSLREAEGDPWLDVNDKFSVGMPVRGTVEKTAKFGIFIALTPGIVGLLPKQVIKSSPQASEIDKLKSGDTIDIIIERIQADDRKISLGLGQSDDEREWRQFSQKTKQKDNQGLGTLGDKLAQALKNK